jgi:predicted ATPase/class 3 adenylate cyclase
MVESPPTGTVSFLFSDVEGSTRLWETNPEAMSSTLNQHDKVMRSAVGDSNGHVFSTAGDSYAVAFARPDQALQAAIAAQAGLTDLAVGDIPLKVRMAVHTGSAEERGGDYFGPAVNRAARLMSTGNGRQVLVSAATAELVQDRLLPGATLHDLGEHRLKDLSRPEHVYQLLHASFAHDTRPLRSLDRFPNNLPIQLTSFVGREEEVAEVTKLLDASRMVTLVGVGGAGKTRLAIQTAAEVLPRYEDGVWLIELAAITDPSRIPVSVMDVLGLEERANEDPIDTITRALAKKQILLILDNCEHIVDPAARFVAAALGAGTGVSILATSREMLGVPGEYPFQVKSLASPESLDDEVRAALMRYPAIQLFAERGELARPGWRISTENADSVIQICQRLDGMPLAIELAAARLRMMRASQIAERLDDRFRLLTGGSRIVLPRQQTLEAAIDWSFDLLSDEEKVLFGRLAVFMGGFTLESAEAVCGVDPLDGYMVLDLLGHLVDKSLVQAEEKEDGLRYRMLETLRQYARQRLAESAEVETMRRRHAHHFRDLAAEAEPNLRGTDEAYWFRRLDDDLDNIRQAMGWALEAGESQLAQAMAGSLYRYFMYELRFVEGREWAEKALAAGDDPTPERAGALLAAGTLAQYSFSQEAAMRHLDEAIALAKTHDLDDVLSAALNNRANVSAGMGKFEEALALHKENVNMARSAGDHPGVIIGLHNVANLVLDLGDAESALAYGEEALAEAIAFGSERLIFMSRVFLFDPLRAMGNLDRIEEVIATARKREAETGTNFSYGYLDAWSSIVCSDRGDYEAAARNMTEGLRNYRGMPDPDQFAWGMQFTLWQGARLFGYLGRPELSARLLGAADAVYAETNYVRRRHTSREIEEIASRLRETLGEEAFDAGYTQGEELDPRDALDLLMDALKAHLAEAGESADSPLPRS